MINYNLEQVYTAAWALSVSLLRRPRDKLQFRASVYSSQQLEQQYSETGNFCSDSRLKYTLYELLKGLNDGLSEQKFHPTKYKNFESATNLFEC